MKSCEPKKVIIALLVAAAAPAMPFVFIQLLGYVITGPGDYPPPLEIFEAWFMVFIVALFHALALGLPAYLFAIKFQLTYWWVSLVGGFLIGALPVAISGWPSPDSDFKMWDGKAMVDHFVTHGITIKAEWLDYLGDVCGMGFYGMAGGFAAWLTWRCIK